MWSNKTKKCVLQWLFALVLNLYFLGGWVRFTPTSNLNIFHNLRRFDSNLIGIGPFQLKFDEKSPTMHVTRPEIKSALADFAFYAFYNCLTFSWCIQICSIRICYHLLNYILSFIISILLFLKRFINLHNDNWKR